MRGIIAMASVAALALPAIPAAAQLSVDRLWVDFEPGAPRRADVVVRNESADRYYITVTAAELINPGTDTEQRVEQSDPEQLGLLVTPNRLVIEPGGLRSLRIVSLNDDSSPERIYRVKVTPQIGEIQADTAEGARGIAIKILAAYDILVTSRPAKPKPELTAVREGDELIITNRGNSNSLLYEGKACLKSSSGASNGQDGDCIDLGARRLHPGNIWKVSVPASYGKVSFKQRVLASSDPTELNF